MVSGSALEVCYLQNTREGIQACVGGVSKATATLQTLKRSYIVLARPYLVLTWKEGESAKSKEAPALEQHNI